MLFLCILLLEFLFQWNSLNLFAQESYLRFEHLTVDDGLPQNTVQGIVKDKYGFMWFGTWEGLCRFDGYKFTIYKNELNNKKSIYNNRIQLLYKDKEQNIWVCGADTLISKYNYLTDDFTRYTHEQLPDWLIDSLDRFKNTSFTSIKTKNYSWIVYQLNNILTRRLQPNEINNLLTQTNLNTGKQIIYHTDPINRWSLSDEYVFNIYLDNENMLWVGTYSGGVNKADLRQKQFDYFYHKYNDNNSIIDNLVRAFCVDKEGNLWVGTHNKGITRINFKTNIYTHYQAKQKITPYEPINNLIRKIYNDRFGYIWIATKGGLDKFDPKTGIFKHYLFPLQKGMPANWVYYVMEDHNGYLWAGTWTGLAKYDRKNDRFYTYNPITTLPDHKIRAILEDKNYNLWVSTEGGLAKISRDSSSGFVEKLTPEFFKHNPSNKNSLTDNRIYSFYIDSAGILWLGTAKGLNRFDPVKNEFMNFGSDDGLPDELIVGILDDHKGNLWLSHKRGLSKFNMKTHSIRNYTKFDGLQSNDFSEDAFYRDPATGMMYFGGVMGFNSFYPDSIKENPYKPTVRFTELKINNTVVELNQKYNGRVILNKPIYLTKKLILTNPDKLISIEFSGLLYSSPKTMKYKYMLVGFDNSWINCDADKREAIYSNLSPGKYVLKVKASNGDGLWNETPTELNIVVKSPWYLTWWFIFLSILSIISIIILYIYRRSLNYIRQQNYLTSQVEERTKELKEINDLLIEKQILIQEQAEQLLETNNELSLTNSTKDKLFSIIAHDLRNPFNVVMGFAEILLLRYEELTHDKIEKYLNLIYNSSKTGSSLLENLLDWSRMQTGRLIIEPEIINLEITAKEVLKYVDGEIQRKNLTIAQSIDPAIRVIADLNMLKTIIRNLISNAIKFTNEGGSITVNASIKESYIEISVTDTGTGMTSEILNQLFRVDSTITKKGTSNESGTGLGLIICKEFVEKQNGKIWATSKLNKGSTFFFTLPKA